MAKKPEYVQLEAGDDVPAVRDRLSFIRGQNVLLIWPEEGTALQRKLDLVLIQREARRRALRLALVTHDPVVIKHADELNISTFETIGASERGRWRRGRSKVFTSRFHRPEDEPEPDDLVEVASRVRARLPSISGMRRKVTRVGVFVVLLVTLSAVGYFVGPSATITVQPARQVISVDVPIIADPAVTSVNQAEGIIPATTIRVEVQQTSSIETTGTAETTEILATGTVIFQNQTNEPVEISAGTTVSTSAGTPILFYTSQAITVPAGVGQQTEVQVEARGNSSGAVGNVESGMINTVIGPLENRVTVRNLAPTTGGATRVLPAVSEEDRSRLRSIVLQQSQQQAFVEMEGMPRRESQFIVIETVHVAEERADWTIYSAEVGEVADTLTLTMRVAVEAVLVDEEFAQQVARTRMEVPRGRIIVGRPDYVRGGQTVDGAWRVHFTITGTANVVAQINAAQVQERLAGLSLEAAQTYLNTQLDIEPGSTPQIIIAPDWFGQMPMLPIRITVQVVDG